jgi:hypothetical protein
VAAVVVVVALEPVQGAGPGDAGGRCGLAFIVRVHRGGVRVVPGPLLLDVGEPGAHVGGVAEGGERRALFRERDAAQLERAARGELERETVAGDVVVAERERGELLALAWSSW